MYDLFIYSLKTGACLAVFYLFFKLLLSRETLHRFNRVVVLAGMVLAFALPLCVITVYRELPVLPQLPAVETAAAPALPEEPAAAFDWTLLAGVLYMAGVVGMLGWLARSFCALFRVIRSGQHELLDSGAVLVRVQQRVTPFSWGRYVVVSEEDLATAGREILLHEQAHRHLHHSVDLLITDLAGSLQWFNPAMWLLRRELRAIHEYEADRAVIESGVDARDYQLLLIRKAVGGRWYSVANSFNHSKLKNRITMMLRKESSRWTGVKALFVLPLTAIAVGAFARTAYVVPDDKVNKESVTVNVSSPNISLDGLDGQPLYLVDGQEVASLDGIEAEKVASIEVLKDEQAIKTYGDKARNGVVLVTLKKENGQQTQDAAVEKVVVIGYRGNSAPSGPEPLYLVDGKEVDAEYLNRIAPERIASLEVIKDQQAVKTYGDKARNGVVIITLYKNGEQPKKTEEKTYVADDVVVIGYGTQTKEEMEAMRKAQEYFESDEWKEAQRKVAGIQEYFESDEWKAAQQQLEEASKKAAEAGKSMESQLAGRVVAIHADKYAEQQTEEGVTRSTGRITVIDEGAYRDYRIFINGKRSTPEELAAIPNGKIRRMEIYKGEKAVEKFGEEGRGGVIDIQAKIRKK